MRLKDCNKIIVFGGSFDPPHIAHVRLPGIVMQAVDADAVAYVPTGVQPERPLYMQAGDRINLGCAAAESVTSVTRTSVGHAHPLDPSPRFDSKSTSLRFSIKLLFETYP